jgi:hypothetical protein
MRLILTANSSSAGALKHAGRADLVIPIERRFVWGPPPADAELVAYLAPRTTQKPGAHWLDHVGRPIITDIGTTDVGLVDLFRRYEAVELWMETEPSAQLVLIWLLDHLHSHSQPLNDIILRHVDSTLVDAEPDHRPKWTFPGVEITSDHLETATRAWHAYREPTPQAWFNLLKSDLSIPPQLRRCVLELLEELPGRTTGLGASEMRILELISAGYEHPSEVFPHYRQRFQRRVFDYWEVGALLEGLALAPVRAVSGLAEWPFTIEMHNQKSRLDRYKASRLSLTPLGKAILGQAEDFSRHNPIHRWWGGTELTNNRLWRWDPTLAAP